MSSQVLTIVVSIIGVLLGGGGIVGFVTSRRNRITELEKQFDNLIKARVDENDRLMQELEELKAALFTLQGYILELQRILLGAGLNFPRLEQPGERTEHWKIVWDSASHVDQ